MEQELITALKGMLDIVHSDVNDKVRGQLLREAISVYQSASGKTYNPKFTINQIVRKMSSSELVCEIEWLINNYPGAEHESLRELDHEYGSRLRQIFHSVDFAAAVVASRCLNGVMDADGFTFEKLKTYWLASRGLPDEQRLKSLINSQWRDLTSTIGDAG